MNLHYIADDAHYAREELCKSVAWLVHGVAGMVKMTDDLAFCKKNVFNNVGDSNKCRDFTVIVTLRSQS